MEINEAQKTAGKIAREKGWWDDERENGTLIALMHSELSEALEADREGNLTGKDGVAEELADTVIRILDFCDNKGIDLEQEVIEKMKINADREFKHGGKKY